MHPSTKYATCKSINRLKEILFLKMPENSRQPMDTIRSAISTNAY